MKLLVLHRPTGMDLRGTGLLLTGHQVLAPRKRFIPHSQPLNRRCNVPDSMGSVITGSTTGPRNTIGICKINKFVAPERSGLLLTGYVNQSQSRRLVTSTSTEQSLSKALKASGRSGRSLVPSVSRSGACDAFIEHCHRLVASASPPSTNAE